jgi:colicin import membrane protein
VSAAALSARDAFAPRRPPGMGPGLMLALIVHVFLILALAWSVNWKTSEPEGVVAELWSSVPQFAAPRVSLPEPRPPVVEPRPVPPAPRPEPVTPPRQDAQIAIERAEAAKKAEAAKREEVRRADAERDRQRLADEQAEKKKLAEKARQDEARDAAIHEANLRRMMKQAGSSDDPAANGTVLRTSGPSASWVGRVMAQIRRNIVFDNTDVVGNPMALVEVRLTPDGTITSRKLLKSSGLPLYDEAVLRAIDKTERLPRENGEQMPSSFTIEFRPKDRG